MLCLRGFKCFLMCILPHARSNKNALVVSFLTQSRCGHSRSQFSLLLEWVVSGHCDVAVGSAVCSAIGSAIHSAIRRAMLASLFQEPLDRDKVGTTAGPSTAIFGRAGPGEVPAQLFAVSMPIFRSHIGRNSESHGKRIMEKGSCRMIFK